MDSAAKGYHLAYENLNYDFMTNGEYFLASTLNNMNNLEFVIDVGANIGEYSTMIRSLSQTCKIAAFEPVKSTFEQLNNRTNGLGIEIHNSGLGSFVGKSQISIVPNRPELASLVENLQEGIGWQSETIEVEVTTGLKYMQDNKIERISLLKIDTEGYESEVLKGFAGAIEKADVIQFEYGKTNLFSRYFLHDYYRDYSDTFFIGKLYPTGVSFYDTYNCKLDDLIGPNYVMISKKRRDIKAALEL